MGEPTPEQILEQRIINLESKVQQLIFINSREMNIFSKYRELIEIILKQSMTIDDAIYCHERALKILKEKL